MIRLRLWLARRIIPKGYTVGYGPHFTIAVDVTPLFERIEEIRREFEDERDRHNEGEEWKNQ